MEPNKPRILVIDDEPELLKVLETSLRVLNYTVDTAHSGEEGIEKIERDSFDLVLTDLVMPGLGGRDVIRRVRRIAPELKVVVMTAHGTIESSVESMREGAVDYITKPLNFDEMHVVLQRALRTGNGARGKRPRGPMMLIGDSPVMQKLRSAIEMVADSSASVLIQGESGTGKEVVARAIHARSARADKPFVSCSCGAFAETLLMSELFGHERGAFTGAYELKKGLFEQADGGTLLLDEIAETSPQCQTALLRALATREVARVGHKESVPVDFRLLSATNKNLYDEVCSGRFREDLYYRINVVIINVPALRERAEDIPVLAEHFLRRFRGEQNKPIEAISPEAMDVLLASTWPGNVRQLESAIEHAVLMCTASRIRPGDLPAQVSGGSATPASLPPSLDVLPIKAAIDVFQKHYLGQVLEKTDGNVSEAAKLAQIARQSFYEMMRRLGLEPSSYRA